MILHYIIHRVVILRRMSAMLWAREPTLTIDESALTSVRLARIAAAYSLVDTDFKNERSLRKAGSAILVLKLTT